MAPAPRRLRADELLRALAGLNPSLMGEIHEPLTGVTDHSKEVLPGSVFVVRGGAKTDGERFVTEARTLGASLLVTRRGSALGVPRIEVDDVPRALGLLAHRFWDDPSQRLQVLAITGTNGKTTTAYLVEQALERAGFGVARLGTLGFFVNGERQSDSLTTPGAVHLARALALATARGAEYCVMEVSSHALAQDRVRGVRFRGAAFSNLSQDHLDYHGTMESYGAEKAKLFLEHSPELSIINVDDPFGEALADQMERSRPELALARFSRRAGSQADIRAAQVRFQPNGLTADLVVFGESCALRSELVGAHNLENLLAALGLLVAAGMEPRKALAELGRARAAPGRLERVNTDEDDITVLIDYAHTPAALEGVLRSLRETRASAIACVFGCGGDRDRGKRPLMGRVASELADSVIITTDNARSEPPEAIARDIVAGISTGAYRIVLDRRAAIFEAVESAEPGTTILVAGKGHETSQTIGPETLPFDDAEVAREALALRRQGAALKGS